MCYSTNTLLSYIFNEMCEYFVHELYIYKTSICKNLGKIYIGNSCTVINHLSGQNVQRNLNFIWLIVYITKKFPENFPDILHASVFYLFCFLCVLVDCCTLRLQYRFLFEINFYFDIKKQIKGLILLDVVIWCNEMYPSELVVNAWWNKFITLFYYI